MRNKKLMVLLSGMILALAQSPVMAGAAWQPVAGNAYIEGQVLVKFKSGLAASTRSQLAQAYGAQAMQTISGQADLIVANLTPGKSVEQAVSAYASDPNVVYAQPNYVYHASAVPSDPQYGQLWAAKNTGQTISTGSYSPVTGTAGNDMNLELAWDVQTDCSSVVIAVVDSGINYNSTDLVANMWAGNAKHGQNFAADGASGDPMDLAGHGTHVAGIIGAAANNGTGGAGVCWSAKLMAVRVLDATGTGTTSSIISGVNYAVANGAKIINMSLGGAGSFDQAFSDAITNAQASNVLVVVAAGNNGQDNETTPHWPCNFTQPNLICVAALDQNYALAGFSDYGAASVDVGAPGTNIYSTWAGTNAVINDLVSYVTPTGWSSSSTTAGTGGGVGGTTTGWLIDPPSAPWGTALYNANTDDRVYKQFNIAGVDVALLDLYAAINVRSGDYFKANFKSAGGDPFVSGTNFASFTNVATGTSASYSGKINISSCISATCSVGFQLTSAAASARDIGFAMTNLNITTLTLNNASYKTIDGTSMATPEVTGVAALVWAHNPLYTYADVVSAIRSGGRSVTALSGKTSTGKAVDAMGSLAYINPPTGVAVVVH